MVPQLDAAGCKFVGKDDTQTRMEICEVDGHPFMVGCQYHPEYKSRPGKPSPLFMGLILAASGQLPEYISDEAIAVRQSEAYADHSSVLTSPLKVLRNKQTTNK